MYFLQFLFYRWITLFSTTGYICRVTRTAIQLWWTREGRFVVELLSQEIRLICFRRGDWPAVPGKREPRGALQAPRARDHFYPDWRQVIVTWFDSLPIVAAVGAPRRQGSADGHRLYSHRSIRVPVESLPRLRGTKPDDAVPPSHNPLWRVLFHFTWVVFPWIDPTRPPPVFFIWNKLLSITDTRE